MTVSETNPGIAATVSAPEYLPCSASQERCWFLDQMNPGTPALNVAIRWNVTGRFTAAAFEAAFRAVIARHEILRTRFVAVNGRPMQQVTDRVAFHLSEIDIRTTARADQDDRVDAIAIENASLPFDLTQPNPIRATLIRLAEGHAILAITVHQICFDGWSIRVLGREVGTYAAAFAAGTEAALDELPLQYGDYALWQKDYFASDAFAQDLAPWVARLTDAPYFEVQPDFPRPLTRTSTCGMVKTDMPPAFGIALTQAAQSRAMSPFAFGAGVLTAMLSRCADTAEVTIGTQVAGRVDVDLEPLIGVFINNVVLRFPVASDMSLGAHIDTARSVVQDALIGQTVPFNKLVEILNPARDASRTPLISVNFIQQNAFMETAAYGDFEMSSAPSHAPGAIYDLSFVLIGRESGWQMTLEYNADLFDAATADALLSRWQAAFALAFDAPQTRLSDMPRATSGTAARDADTRRLRVVERTLEAHDQVAEAAALTYAGTDGRQAAHAFVTLRDDSPIVPLEIVPGMLADHLRARDPDGLHPDGISVLRDLPRDATGRTDRARLPLDVAVRRLQATRQAQSTTTSDAVAAAEARLVPIWSDLLGLDTVPPTANFFDHGGHSLLTVRMLARIQRAFGRSLSLSQVYHAPTLQALARLLAGSDDAPEPVSDWRVLVLKGEGTGVPLVAINNANTVYAIADAFDVPRPAMAVRTHDKSRGIALTPRPFTDIAADYADAVRSAQPHGPYALFGLCVHGNLAIEVARILQQQGEEVALVVLKDVWEPRYATRIKASRRASLLDKLHFLKVRLRFVRRGDMSVAAFLGTFRLIRASGILTAAVRLGLMDRVRTTDLDAEQEEFIAHLSAARNAHEPEPYAGRVLHIVTEEAPSGPCFDPQMGWGDVVTGPMTTVRIPELRIAKGRAAGVSEAARAIAAALDAAAHDATPAANQKDQTNAT